MTDVLDKEEIMAKRRARRAARRRGENVPNPLTELRHISELGDEIRAARIAMGMTQVELAEAAELGQTTISMIELGKRHGTPETRQRLASVLGLDVARLFVLAGDIPSAQKLNGRAS